MSRAVRDRVIFGMENGRRRGGSDGDSGQTDGLSRWRYYSFGKMTGVSGVARVGIDYHYY